MNHTLLKDLPHISTIYNKNRYQDRLYSCNSPEEIYSLIYHGIKNKYIDDGSMRSIYIDADRRTDDDEMEKVGYIMDVLDPILSRPSFVSLSVIL